jgi:hypothetical protein
LDFLFWRKKNQIPTPIKAITTTPPITPPTMAPMLSLLEPPPLLLSPPPVLLLPLDILGALESVASSISVDVVDVDSASDVSEVDVSEVEVVDGDWVMTSVEKVRPL